MLDRLDLPASVNITGAGECKHARWLPYSSASHVNEAVINCSTPIGVGVDHSVLISLGNNRPIMGFVTSKTPPTVSYCPPSVLSLAPSAGLVRSGGDLVTVSGANFGASRVVAGVRVGKKECTSVTHLSHTQISFVSPAADGDWSAHADVEVVVANQTGLNKGLFVYEKPAVEMIVPTTAPYMESFTMMIIGKFLGTKTENTSDVTIGGVPCRNVTVLVDDLVLQCEVPPGKGVNLPVAVTARSETSRSLADRTSNMDMLFSFGEQVEQLVVVAELEFQPPVTLSDDSEDAGDIRAALLRTLSHYPLVARSSSYIEDAYIVGIDQKRFRSTDGPMTHFEVAFTVVSASAASLVRQALNSTKSYGFDLAMAVRDATGISNSTAVLVTGISRNTSIYCKQGMYRTIHSRSYFCSPCPAGQWQAYGSIWGEPCSRCPADQGVECTAR